MGLTIHSVDSAGSELLFSRIRLRQLVQLRNDENQYPILQTAAMVHLEQIS
jgi:hypothetical protein